MNIINALISIPIYTLENESYPIPIDENYDYWIPIITTFLLKANKVEIHCWNEEREIIDEINKHPKLAFEIDKEGNLTIFKGSLSATLTNFLITKYSSENNRFKWFTINLLHENKTLLHAGHWATEFLIANFSNDDVNLIKNKTPIHTRFHLYEDKI